MRGTKGIDWELVLLALDYRPKLPSFRLYKEALTWLVDCFWRTSPKLDPIPQGNTLCMITQRREDCHELWDPIYGSIPGAKSEVKMLWLRGFGMSTLRRLKYLPEAFACTRVKKGLAKRLQALTYAWYAVEALHLLKNVRPSRVLVFSDMQKVDNAVVQFFKQRSIPTATLQHGLYIDYGQERIVNRINYEAVCADTFLAWGRETRELVHKYHPATNVVLCGEPLLQENITETGQPCVYIVFDGDINYIENRKLLKIGLELAESMSVEPVLCLHPRNNEQLYALSGLARRSRTDGYGRPGFVVGHTTTQLIKLARLGKKVYKMKSEQPCNQLIPESIFFSDAAELLEKVENAEYPSQWAHNHLAYVGNASLEAYKNFFESWWQVSRSNPK